MSKEYSVSASEVFVGPINSVGVNDDKRCVLLVMTGDGCTTTATLDPEEAEDVVKHLMDAVGKCRGADELPILADDRLGSH